MSDSYKELNTPVLCKNCLALITGIQPNDVKNNSGFRTIVCPSCGNIVILDDIVDKQGLDYYFYSASTAASTGGGGGGETTTNPIHFMTTANEENLTYSNIMSLLQNNELIYLMYQGDSADRLLLIDTFGFNNDNNTYYVGNSTTDIYFLANSSSEVLYYENNDNGGHENEPVV